MKKFFRYLVGSILAVFILAAVIYLFFAARSRPMSAHPFFRPDDSLLVMAHQGGDGERPSNTMMAFEHAAELGVDALEMDVHSTRDGVLVVIHDATIDRTTDGSGRVNDFTFEELQQFDAGYDWPTLAEESHRTDRPFRGQGAKIPALEEVLASFPEMRMLIEIKQETPSIVQPLCDLLREYSMEDQTMVASFKPQPLYELRRTCPEVATAAVEEEIRPFFFLNSVGLGRAYQSSAHAFQVPEYGGGFHVLTQLFVDGAHLHNVEVHPWTINDEESMQRMIGLGVDGMITDYPGRLMELLKR